MTIYVYHNEQRGSRFEDDANACRQAIAAGKLHLVASVDTDELETAFRLTNNINSPWIDNDGVDPVKVPDGARSTSVGDVLIAEENGREVAYMVGGFGFTRLGIPADRLMESDMRYSQAQARKNPPSRETLGQFLADVDKVRFSAA